MAWTRRSRLALGIPDTRSLSRGWFCPSFAVSFALFNQEGAGKAGRRLAPAVCCAKGKKNGRTAAYRWAGHPAFPARWVDGLCRASPGSDALLPPSPRELTMRFPRSGLSHLRSVWPQQRRPGPPGFAVRSGPHVATGFSGTCTWPEKCWRDGPSAPFVRARFRAHGVNRPARTSRADAAASTASPARDT